MKTKIALIFTLMTYCSLLMAKIDKQNRIYINASYEVHFHHEQDESKFDLPNTLSFNQLSSRRFPLEFSANITQTHSTFISFKDPRINDYVISSEASYCGEYKTNFLGYDICQRIVAFNISDELCQQIGLNSSKANTIERVRSTSEAITYKYGRDSKEWSILRLGSFLAPPIYFRRLKTLECYL